MLSISTTKALVSGVAWKEVAIMLVKREMLLMRFMVGGEVLLGRATVDRTGSPVGLTEAEEVALLAIGPAGFSLRVREGLLVVVRKYWHRDIGVCAL